MPQVSAVEAQKAVYDYNHVHTCLCLIEEMVAPNLAGEPWQDYRDQWGINGLRDVVIEKLAGACNTAWSEAYARYEQEMERHRGNLKTWEYDHAFAMQVSGDLPEKPEEPKEPGSFDYEFVPFWLRTCVDWSGNHPRVKGSTR